MRWAGTMITRKGLGFLSVLLLVAVVWTVVPETAAQSPVAEAAKANDIRTVRALILKKADVNATETDGSTALLWAAYNGNLEMTKALLAAGAKADQANRYGLTPLLQASGTGDTAIIAALLKAGASPNLTHPQGETALMAAARAGHDDSVRLLVANGANVNAADKFQEQTALMWAAAEGHVKVVQTLLEVGANPNMRAHVTTLTERKSADHPSGGFTALMFAARNGHEQILRDLVKAGADLKMTNGDEANGLNGETALIIAIVNDRFDLAKKMVEEMGANPNDGALYFAVDMHDATTDMRARDGSRLRPDNRNVMTSMDLIKFLVEKGADPNKPFIGQLHNTSMCCGDFHAASPFYKAAMQSDVAVLDYLLAHGAKADWVPEQVNAPGAGRGANANYGRPALFVAMTGGRGAAFGAGPGFSREGPPPFREPGVRKPADAVKVLLKAGADANVWSWPDNAQPIHRAVAAGNLDVIRALVAAGAKIDAYDGNGDTPLSLAEKANTPEAIKRAEDAIIAAIANGTPVPTKGAPPQEVVNTVRELMGLPPEAPKAAPAAQGGSK